MYCPAALCSFKTADFANAKVLLQSPLLLGSIPKLVGYNSPSRSLTPYPFTFGSGSSYHASTLRITDICWSDSKNIDRCIFHFGACL